MKYALLPVKIAALIIEWTVKIMILSILVGAVAFAAVVCASGAVFLCMRQGGFHVSWITDGSGDIRRNKVGYRWRESTPVMSERISRGI